MGIMYAWKCDLCGEIQCKENPHDIKGSTHTEGGTTKFTCTECEGILAGAIGNPKAALGGKGIPTTPLIGHDTKPLRTEPHPDQPKTKTRKLRDK